MPLTPTVEPHQSRPSASLAPQNTPSAPTTRPTVPVASTSLTDARRITELARQVASWARKARQATARRDMAIVAMRAEGASLRTIADAAGLSHAGVLRILHRHGSK